MKTSTLNRLYDRFTPAERLRLTLVALAREDDAERDRLTRTCPRFTYDATDMEYQAMVNGTLTMALAWTIDLQDAIWTLTRVARDAETAGDTVGRSAILLAEIRRCVSLWRAWRTWCEETLGVDAETVLEAWPASETVRLHLPILKDATEELEDREATQTYLDLLHKAWQARMLRA